MEPERLVILNRTGGKFQVVSHNVTLQEVTNEKAKGQYQTAEGVHQLVVDPETMKRIKAEPRLMERVRIK